MTKSERINDLMIYLNNKNKFNLKDIMSKYKISKSTALRDIQTLESIGMPLYSEQGRYGCYIILKNRLLSPIIFSLNEIYAMYFAMNTLNAYQSTPFHVSLDKLKNKFHACLSEKQLNHVQKMETVLQLEAYEHLNASPLLKEILDAIIDEKVCLLNYHKGNVVKSYTMQLYSISAIYGQWYASAHNPQDDTWRVFRCDKIKSIEENSLLAVLSTPLDKLLANDAKKYKNPGYVDYSVEIKASSIDHYYKEHYPTMSLDSKGNQWFIRGFYNQNEVSFIADYFMKYGSDVLSVEPESLKILIIEALKKTTTHYQSL